MNVYKVLISVEENLPRKFVFYIIGFVARKLLLIFKLVSRIRFSHTHVFDGFCKKKL